MFREILLGENIEDYADYYNKAFFKTIYHHPQYLLAEEKAEENKTYLYIYEEGEDFIILPSIKRKINDIKLFNGLEEIYYDLKTPHEYSGVIANKYDMDKITAFYRELDVFCRNNHIVFSFIRFNPYSDEHMGAHGYTIKKSDEQIWIDGGMEDISKGFSESRRRNVNNALKRGFTCVETEKNVENLQVFMEMYAEAMDRLSAKKFFYFNEAYFQALASNDFTRLYCVYDEKKCVMAASIVLLDEINKRAYYHLGCRNSAVRDAMALLIATFADTLKTEGYTCIHLGGGATESLRESKARFSDRRIDYFIGYKIFDQDLYRYLCDIFCAAFPEMSESTFLPLYRSEK